jgi:ankyrin repeat protein
MNSFLPEQADTGRYERSFVVNKSVPTRVMRAHPDLKQLKRQAKELLDAFFAGDPGSAAEVAAHHRDANPATFALHDAQLVLARAYGFPSWTKLKAYVDGVTAKNFKQAIRAGDLEEVREMLRLRPELVNLNLSGFHDHALHYAVLERRPEMVRLLLEHGADTGESTPDGALHMAAERGYTEIVEVMRKEAPPKSEAEAEQPAIDISPMTEALRRGDETAMIAFLESHPELVNQHSPRDRATPLHWASAFLMERLAAWLLNHDADVNALSINSNTPLDIAGCGRGWGKTGTAEQVKTIAELLLANGAQRTPRWAVITGDAERLRARHAEGTLGNPLYSDAGLVSLAVRYDRPEILRLLLDLGFDPDERRRLDLDPAEDTWGQPLRDCAEYGKLEMAELLLARAADPNAHIYASGTPLHVAYGKRNTAMIELLERHGGYLDAEMIGWLGLADKAGQLLSDEAAGRLRKEAVPDWAEDQPIAELLLIGGVNHPEILQLALPHIERPRDDPWWAKKLDESCGRGDLTCLRLLLERCDVGKCAPTILHGIGVPGPRSQGFCTAEELVVKAKMLLDAGARLDVRHDWHKTTPLAAACGAGTVEMVRLFLERGADPVEVDAEPWATPRAQAEKMKHETVLALLRDYQHRVARE